MYRAKLKSALLLVTLLMLPALALAQPSITSIWPTRTSANTGATINIYGSGFGSLNDLVYFPDSTGPHVVHPMQVIAGGVRVRVPETWSGDVRIQANGAGSLSNGVPLEISFNYSDTKWLEHPFTWFLNVNGAPGNTFEETRVALSKGYNTWSCASGVTHTYGGSTTTAATAYDGENCRYWSSTGWSPGTIAVCSWWSYPGEILEADIAFNSQHYDWSTTPDETAMDIQNIGTHEEGHSIGLLDLYGDLDVDKTMYGFSGNGVINARTLHYDDALGVEYMYPHSRANFTATTPSGWSYPVVPRNTSDGSSTYAPLPVTLNGNTTTYFNASAINNGYDCASPSGLNNIYLDGVYLGWTSWHGVWGDGYSFSWNNLGISVRGGRHTLMFTQDVNEETQETSEADNAYSRQYVWSPYLLADQVPVYRSAPPVMGTGSYPNCDGFQFATGGSWWGAVGIMPLNATDDYDVILYNETPTSQNGFDTNEAWSTYGQGDSDFVLVNGNNGGGSDITRWAGVTRWSGGDNGVYVQLSEALGSFWAPVTTPTQTIHGNDIVNVHEVYLGTATSWDFTLDNLSGSANLGVAIYAATGTHFAKQNHLAMANFGGAGADETLTFVAPATGYYGLVVFKTDYADLGDANTYLLDVQLTPPNLKPDAATGWDNPLVLRNDNAASAGNVHVSSMLDGNATTTYINVSGINDGPNPAESNQTRLYLDEDYIRWINWNVINSNQRYWYLNAGPHAVRGGRHMIEWRNDWDNLVVELNEDDNDHIRQYVWTPYPLTDQIPLVRAVPPPRGNDHGFIYPNCDGFEFTWSGYWGAVGILPADLNSDYDIRMHNDPVNSTNGFDTYEAYSVYGSGLSDFVMVNGNNAGGSTGTRQVGTTRWGTTTNANYTIHQSNRVALVAPPDTLLSQGLSANQVLKVYEVWISSSAVGSYSFELDQTAGSANLGFSLYDQSGVYYRKGDYIAQGNSNGDGADEAFTIDITNSGYYAVVVWKNSYADLGKTSTFDLRINLSPPNLKPYAATGWDYPVVPRNDDTAVHGNAHVSSVLDGNLPTTYLAQCGINDGANPAPLNHTRYYLDGEYIWWVDYGLLTSGQVYFATQSGPLTIRGGRHTIRWANDWDNLVPELDETDNDYTHQFVWSPLPLLDETPLARAAPPARGSLTYPNSDGFSYTGTPYRAWASALCPYNAGDDYDLTIYSNYVGAQSGFTDGIVGSGNLAGFVDYCGSSWGAGGIPRYPAAIFFSGGTAGLTMDAADSGPSHVSTVVPVSWTGETLPSTRLVDVFEVELTSGTQYLLTLTNVSGGADLIVDAQPPSVMNFNGNTAEFSWDTAGGGGNEGGNFIPSQTGRYVFVVHKKGSADRTLNVNYNFSVAFTATPVDESDLPVSFALQRNVPNPFNPMTVIKYQLPQGGNLVRLEVFDISGQRIRTLISEVQQAGYHEVVWDGRSDSGQQMSSGMYFYRLRAGDFQRTEKMTLLK